MKRVLILFIGIFALLFFTEAGQNTGTYSSTGVTDPEEAFTNPPESAKPGVLWMWMGCNITKEGITKDLEALKKAGFNRTTMFSLADITTSLSAGIDKSPTPEVISWTEPWWDLVRYAAEESKRLGMEFGMFNCPGYETSGGPWITPELSMQDICWSEQRVNGNRRIQIKLDRPEVNPRSNHPFPHYNRETGEAERPVIPARKTYYKDIAVLAVPAKGNIKLKDIIDLTDKMESGGRIDWNAPRGEWIIYRFGHTTKGALVFPAQWQSTGLECDKMSREAVEFHIGYVISEIQKHLGDLAGKVFTHVHFDSYEAGIPTWTPKMREEFLKRRGYDLTPYLVTFAGRNIGSSQDSIKFRDDFDATIKDLYRDIYFNVLSEKLREANLTFLCEPYGGPWRQDEIMPLVHHVMTEFWTNEGTFTPHELEPTVAALRKSGQNIVEAEAFTGQPQYSKWTETPSWLKPIGDGAFCAGVNRLIIHRFVHQPWDDWYKPGATMGQWGTHFDRTQTWWDQSAAVVKYWQRCQALLQWGNISQSEDDFSIGNTEGSIIIDHIHRESGHTDIYFIANTSHHSGSAVCAFGVCGLQPELWDPVNGTMRDLPEFKIAGGKTTVPLNFDDAQSYFIVFRNKTGDAASEEKRNFPSKNEVLTFKGPWQVIFDPVWGGPAEQVVFESLEDWIDRPEPGIKYYSGTATYKTTFDLSDQLIKDRDAIISLDLGKVKQIARVKLNNKDLGVIWTAPWDVIIPKELLHKKDNQIEIQVTNVWANRLIGDEQQPADCKWAPGRRAKAGNYLKEFPDWFLRNEYRPSKKRFCFTTWNYFTKDSPLISSGLLGPVTLIKQNRNEQ